MIGSTWDPGDPLTVSGVLWKGSENCEMESVIANADSVIVTILPADDPYTNPGHKLCGSPSYRRAFSPGTNSSGEFSVTIRGGRVSFLGGDMTEYCGSTVKLEFKEGGSVIARVVCGISADWPVCFPCDDAPAIYGVLASPDLNGSLYVDASDLSVFQTYLGHPITKYSGWQADFNHSGNVDASDLSYFAGRLGKNCDSQKAGGVEYAMDVRNLHLDYLQDFLRAQHLTNADIVAAWDQMGLSYDHQAAAVILATQGELSTDVQPWGAVKSLYR